MARSKEEGVHFTLSNTDVSDGETKIDDGDVSLREGITESGDGRDVSSWSTRADALIYQKMYKLFYRLGSRLTLEKFSDDLFIDNLTQSLLALTDFSVEEFGTAADLSEPKNRLLEEIFRAERQIQESATDAREKSEIYLGRGEAAGYLLTYTDLMEAHHEVVLKNKQCNRGRCIGLNGVEYKVSGKEVSQISSLDDVKRAHVRSYVKYIVIDRFEREIEYLLYTKSISIKSPSYMASLDMIVREQMHYFMQRREYKNDHLSIEDCRKLPVTPVSEEVIIGFKRCLANRLLLSACKYNQLAVATYAIEGCKANPNLKTHSQKTPLIIAIEYSFGNSHSKLVGYLLEKFDIRDQESKKTILDMVNGKNFLDRGNKFSTLVRSMLRERAERSERFSGASAGAGSGSVPREFQRSTYDGPKPRIRVKMPVGNDAFADLESEIRSSHEIVVGYASGKLVEKKRLSTIFKEVVPVRGSRTSHVGWLSSRASAGIATEDATFVGKLGASGKRIRSSHAAGGFRDMLKNQRAVSQALQRAGLL